MRQSISTKSHRAVLIATLGTKPQVVSAGWDLLLERGEPLRELVILHTSPDHPPIGLAIRRLRGESWRLPASRCKRGCELTQRPIINRQERPIGGKHGTEPDGPFAVSSRERR